MIYIIYITYIHLCLESSDWSQTTFMLFGINIYIYICIYIYLFQANIYIYILFIYYIYMLNFYSSYIKNFRNIYIYCGINETKQLELELIVSCLHNHSANL